MVLKFTDELKKTCVNKYNRAWALVAPGWPNPSSIPSGKSKWDLVKRCLADLKIAPTNKMWWAWLNLGPIGLNCSALKSPRLVSGGPHCSAEEFATRHTAETMDTATTGRSAMRQQMRGNGRVPLGATAAVAAPPGAHLPKTWEGCQNKRQ
ncbi:hypothetical protein B484DRAFT_41456 [Ochromonadaceae sp. CCMP2298]|nr:hypothetical protein B484DRAFT_41456 [Ochromonadaceae sp. CCMP2298]